MSPERAKERQEGVVAVIPRDGKLLVIRRSKWVRAPRAFCFPGGGIESDEGEEQALVRELNEELAVRIRPQRRLWRSVTPWDVPLAWWLAELCPNETLRPAASEVESAHWLEVAEIQQLEGLLESNRDFLTAWQRRDFQFEL